MAGRSASVIRRNDGAGFFKTALIYSIDISSWQIAGPARIYVSPGEIVTDRLDDR
jgi:hypothetical protein